MLKYQNILNGSYLFMQINWILFIPLSIHLLKASYFASIEPCIVYCFSLSILQLLDNLSYYSFRTIETQIMLNKSLGGAAA